MTDNSVKPSQVRATTFLSTHGEESGDAFRLKDASKTTAGVQLSSVAEDDFLSLPTAAVFQVFQHIPDNAGRAALAAVMAPRGAMPKLLPELAPQRFLIRVHRNDDGLPMPAVKQLKPGAKPDHFQDGIVISSAAHGAAIFVHNVGRLGGVKALGIRPDGGVVRGDKEMRTSSDYSMGNYRVVEEEPSTELARCALSFLDLAIERSLAAGSEHAGPVAKMILIRERIGRHLDRPAAG